MLVEIVGSSPMAFAKNIYAAFVSYFDLGLKYSSQVLFYMFFIWGISSVGLEHRICIPRVVSSNLTCSRLRAIDSKALCLPYKEN